ncbi:hypothetical protein CCH79_00004800 [Gambusia affinis]|uniref:CUB domain-containing protein n=1 Tax=Gambusia affinis TaxID=33528 RepID=A0A315V814_GAMAF|nr:hypothetical protein CCH79_00004800 [Gambusia affinis]
MSYRHNARSQPGAAGGVSELTADAGASLRPRCGAPDPERTMGPTQPPSPPPPPPPPLLLLPLIGLLWCRCVPFCAAACTEQVEVHTERRGVLYSPAWPLNYPPGLNCSWHIQGSPGEVITIR